MPNPRRPVIGRAASWDIGFVLAAGYAAVVIGCLLAAVVAPREDTITRTGVVAAAIGLFTAWAPRAVAAVVVTVLAWCFVTGFLVNTAGELNVEGTTDLIRLGALASAAGVGVLAARVARRSAASRFGHGESRPARITDRPRTPRRDHLAAFRGS